MLYLVGRLVVYPTSPVLDSAFCTARMISSLQSPMTSPMKAGRVPVPPMLPQLDSLENSMSLLFPLTVVTCMFVPHPLPPGELISSRSRSSFHQMPSNMVEIPHCERVSPVGAPVQS